MDVIIQVRFTWWRYFRFNFIYIFSRPLAPAALLLYLAFMFPLWGTFLLQHHRLEAFGIFIIATSPGVLIIQAIRQSNKYFGGLSNDLKNALVTYRFNDKGMVQQTATHFMEFPVTSYRTWSELPAMILLTFYETNVVLLIESDKFSKEDKAAIRKQFMANQIIVQ